MKFFRILFFAILFSESAAANIAVSFWNERTQLTSTGKKTMITIDGKASEIEKGKALSAFSIDFDEEQQIEIIGAQFEGKPVPFVFKDNALRIDFPRPKKSGELISFGFSYEEKYKKVSPIIRQEAITVPKYAKGAVAKIRYDFAGYDLISFLPKMIRVVDGFNYNAPVGEDGLQKVIKFTPKEMAWDVESDIQIESDSGAQEIKVKIPNYFDSARQQVVSKKIEFNQNPIGKETKGSDRWFYFSKTGRNLLIKERARILAGSNHYKQVFINSFPFSKVSDEEAKLLTPILMNIKTDKKYAGLPMYVAIGEFVKDYLKYDKSLVGKRLSLPEIIKGKAGVCIEYAKLYDGLARVAGIPSMILNGIACGNDDQCEGHSWNKIFYVNRWIEVDPTWNLMSGIVSSSHIFAVSEGRDQIQVAYPDNAGKVRIDVGLKMKPVAQNSENAK